MREKCFDIGIRFKEGEAISINRESRSVTVVKEDYTIDVSYDFLILAPGRHPAPEDIPGFFHHTHHLLDVLWSWAKEIHDHYWRARHF